jgi:phenol 2-monooxygenase (NADPH)
MQFYLDGYTPGDPDILEAAAGVANHSKDLPTVVDVLIVGSGPAGTLLAAQLSTFPAITTRLVERRDGPLQLGQADGVACRTVEMLDAFGLSEKLIREAYWVNETVFWRPSPEDASRIVRTGRVQDTEDGLSEFPHVIVNQARLQQVLLDYMRRSPSRLEADYGVEFVTLKVEPEGEHPVVVTLRRSSDGTALTVRAKYVVARRDRGRAARRFRQPRLGRRRYAGGDRFPGYPSQSRDSVEGRHHPAHPA